MTTNQKNLRQVWRIIEDSKTFRPLEEDAYNALEYAKDYAYQGSNVPQIIWASAADSLKQAGYTISHAWWDTAMNSHWPSNYALLVRNDTQ
jgi:hypothetical protein